MSQLELPKLFCVWVLYLHKKPQILILGLLVLCIDMSHANNVQNLQIQEQAGLTMVA